MKATWNNKVVAQSDHTLIIEGNHYFPNESIKKSYFKSSDYHTFCYWKGEASYYNLDVDGELNENAAWYYPKPKEASIPLVGEDYTNYVAFWHGVEVTK